MSAPILPRAAGLALVAMCMPACGQFETARRPVDVQRLSHRTAHGTEWDDLYVGHGRAAGPGDVVVVDYILDLADGTRVTSTLETGAPVSMRLGGAPVPGLDAGLEGIQPTGRRRIVVPAAQGYGSRGLPGLVPPDATLHFEVHCLEVRAAG
jgi:FKBP-type peptidyl-prolyl cis-trans isomerase